LEFWVLFKRSRRIGAKQYWKLVIQAIMALNWYIFIFMDFAMRGPARQNLTIVPQGDES
jgi:hypothetical protein